MRSPGTPGEAPPPADPPLRVLAVTSNKGGVGKTTLAVNLAVYARALREDLPVVVMSFDDQRLPDRMFALDGSPAGKTVLDGMRAGDLGPTIRLGNYGVHYVPSDPRVAELKAETADAFALRRALERSGWHGLVIVDTKSDLEILTRNAIAASDLALVVVSDQASLEEADKVYALLDGIGRPRERARIALSLIDLRVKYRQGEHRDILALLLAGIRRRGLPLLESFVSRSPSIEALYTNAEERSHSILHGARGSLIHRQMRAVAEDVLRLLDELGAAGRPEAMPAAALPGARPPAPSAGPSLVWGRPLLTVEELLGEERRDAATGAEAPRERRERRRHVRRSYRRALPAFRLEEPNVLELRSRDLSEAGVAVEAHDDLALGDRLHLFLDDEQSGDEPLLVWARVARKSGSAAGLAFETPAPPARQRLAALSAKLRSARDLRD